MSDKTWGRIQWVFITIVTLFKKRYPLMSSGVALLVFSYPLKLLFEYTINLNLNGSEAPSWLREIGMTVERSNGFSNISGLLSAVAGMLLICSQLYVIFNNARSKSRVFITGMNAGDIKFPDELIPEIERMDVRETVNLGLSENVNAVDFINESVEMFNAEQKVDIYNRFIFNGGCEKLYLGGLHRIPLLVAYGTRFRANTKNILFFDKVQESGNWSLLTEENKNIQLDIIGDDTVPNENGNVGIAIGFTFPITEAQLPDEFKGHTLFIKPNCDVGHNLIMNQDNLLSICHEIKEEVSRLSSDNAVKKIHFFLCVQSCVALALGTKYQEGMHRNWVIHNYNGHKGEYDWFLEVEPNKVSTNH
ncbi:SAVED domain-containing protein [Shewanella psychromarinicola]|uniref:SAVED domain-containing protein n=1 Tax=Shewanella psychromarinicola TaxID=2487742 RepID=A0A3N4DDF2_9GAMM|nr:SAVED domain-containing protein [Shewanella psychromarinicola]AZG34007.1 SAVED domain-containing protein [Shewanella psychromarinicola]MCL1084418.1 SAVED domain-containing protein [Shewanella psychromarinicola]RPA22587.1 SAVED domain-containing protein [Shewanella psychromarinicola]